MSGPAATLLPARTPPWLRGFSLIELVIVVVIIAIIGAIAAGRFGAFSERAQIAAAQRVARDLQTSVDDYALAYGAYPAVLDASVLGPAPVRHPMAREQAAQIQVFDSATDPARENPASKEFSITPGEGLRPIWYNPASGAVRLRVPETWPADEQLAVYNAINGTALRGLNEVAPGVVFVSVTVGVPLGP